MLTVHETSAAAPPKPRLLDRVRAALRRAPELTRFLSSLAVDGKVAVSTQNQALSALLFLYRVRQASTLLCVARWDRPAG